MSPPVRQMVLSMPPTPGAQNQGFWLPHSQMERNKSTSRYLFCASEWRGNLRILQRAGPLFLCAAAPVHLDIVEAPLRKLQESPVRNVPRCPYCMYFGPESGYMLQPSRPASV